MNIKTDYKIGSEHINGYLIYIVKLIRQDKDGMNEYLMSRGKYERWVTGWELVASWE